MTWWRVDKARTESGLVYKYSSSQKHETVQKHHKTQNRLFLLRALELWSSVDIILTRGTSRAK